MRKLKVFLLLLIPITIIAQVEDPDDRFNIILSQDFEHHDAPIHYSRDLFLADDWNAWEMNGEDHWRAEDFRSPQWFADNVKDSIQVDPITGSKVLRLMYAGGYHDGYDGQSGRGGDYWKTPLPGGAYTEVYYSMNIMLKPGWMENTTSGGKIFPAVQGGTYSGHLGQQLYGEGFWGCVSWNHRYWENLQGNLAFYLYYQGTSGINGTWLPWHDFQPTGGGLTADMYNDDGYFLYPSTDSTWYNITIRCVTNTHTGSSPTYNGILEGYINGRLIEQVGGLYLITYNNK